MHRDEITRDRPFPLEGHQSRSCSALVRVFATRCYPSIPALYHSTEGLTCMYLACVHPIGSGWYEHLHHMVMYVHERKEVIEACIDTHAKI